MRFVAIDGSPRQEGESASCDRGTDVVARNNGIETVGSGIREDTHHDMRIDGLDRCDGIAIKERKKGGVPSLSRLKLQDPRTVKWWR